MKNTKLQEYFPMLKSCEEIRKTVDERENLAGMFNSWEKKDRKNFWIFVPEPKA